MCVTFINFCLCLPCYKWLLTSDFTFAKTKLPVLFKYHADDVKAVVIKTSSCFGSAMLTNSCLWVTQCLQLPRVSIFIEIRAGNAQMPTENYFVFPFAMFENGHWPLTTDLTFAQTKLPVLSK